MKKVKFLVVLLTLFLLVGGCKETGQKPEQPEQEALPKVETVVEEPEAQIVSETVTEEQEPEQPPIKPQPEQPAEQIKETQPEIKENVCTIGISCETVLSNMDKLDPSKKSIIPANGIILAKTQVEAVEGETVFDLLKRITRQEKIHMEFSQTPMYDSAYVEGIANLYEFDCGELSGWMYSVNGTFYRIGSSETTVKSGDVIEWVYTCDLGKDIGDSFAG